ncbi:nucleotidyl transferase AbiEii/AbiGii toxin family protein [Paraburkholderia sp. D15]|uniref:nucleotidyl transferase AbiEii/AbiGii toxin family protein n=1 Tax=Paraburkholderia sp. D15 TaxID=2880218 RepID=UPI00247A437E|nr:nucleotidyl transferase AbiEii/AbiGii toxin family protein [Paraburkholderia sp. D15]WGS48117.1 nucleotidyl transferase AbiEii/AbiGii toxin family protein [Paraburkholderia sp. D15]WKF55985.1 hypothetical protein HUO10_000429 [Paraburkholderia busanensis]
MSSTSIIDLRADRPLPEIVIEMLLHVAATADASRLEWFVGGASARDIVLTHVHGIETTRATADVDIGVSVESWTDHAELKAALITDSAFEQRAEAHRLYYRSPVSGELMWLDIVPFGGVERSTGSAGAAQENEIAWPPDHAVRMNVAGFAEALGDAISVRLAPDLVVPVASLPGQALLKIIAWHDRHAIDRKDAADLICLLDNYADAGNQGRLYDERYDLVEHYGHELESAGAALLGQDAAAIASAQTRDLVEQILAYDKDYPRILDHMMAHSARFSGPTPALTESLFNAFREGFHGLALA